MEVNGTPDVELNSGYKIPLIGFGTMTNPKPTVEIMVETYLDAIRAGYRHFDTAAAYQTEEPLGRAMAQALELGLVQSRDQFFITSKLWCSSAHSDLVLPALKDTLTNLGLDYVDLYLIHWPVTLKKETKLLGFSTEDVIAFDMQRTWEAMEECSKLGLAKSVGVSNFSCHKLDKLLQYSTIPPAVNQVEMNVAWQQKKMLKFCKEKRIHVSAYSPLGAGGAAWGSLAVIESRILKDISDARGKSIAQVALRWIHEQGASVIVKSFNKERLRQNLEIFDWKLDQKDLALIENFPQHKGVLGERFVSPNGPYKSVEEIWDGELESEA